MTGPTPEGGIIGQACAWRNTKGAGRRRRSPEARGGPIATPQSASPVRSRRQLVRRGARSFHAPRIAPQGAMDTFRFDLLTSRAAGLLWPWGRNRQLDEDV
jgi:hypothetical protein